MRICEKCGKDISNRPETYKLCLTCWRQANNINRSIEQIFYTLSKARRSEINSLIIKEELTEGEKNILENFLLLSTEKMDDKQKIYNNLIDLSFNCGIAFLENASIAKKTNLSLEEIEELENKNRILSSSIINK